MSLSTGQTLISDQKYLRCQIGNKIGEGAEAEIYEAIVNSQKVAVKIYFPYQIHEQKRHTIQQLINQNIPPSMSFAWPIDTLTKDQQFGYIMPLIDHTRFYSLKQLIYGNQQAMDYEQMTRISEALATHLKYLHSRALSFKDISDNNLLLNPNTAEICLCDVDNISLESDPTNRIQGTGEFRAPEVIRGESNTSILTDLYSLSVVFFNIWFNYPPFEGRLFLKQHCLSSQFLDKFYAHPIFIFNENDPVNALPDNEEFNWLRLRWELCPTTIKTLFSRALVAGATHPKNRISAHQWQQALRQLYDTLFRCRFCNSPNFWRPDTPNFSCWSCHRQDRLPNRLKFSGHSKRFLVLREQTKILRRHIDPYIADEISNEAVAEVVWQDSWKLQNVSNRVWYATKPDYQSETIPPLYSVDLQYHRKIQMESTLLEVVPHE